MTSRVYRISSRAANRRALAEDEANTLLWRQNLRRVEAEAVRDTMLAVSGTLNLKRGGPSVFPTLPKEVHGTQDSSGKGWADSPADEQNRRSVYLVVKRALKVPLLECLDFANSASPVGVRAEHDDCAAGVDAAERFVCAGTRPPRSRRASLAKSASARRNKSSALSKSSFNVCPRKRRSRRL